MRGLVVEHRVQCWPAELREGRNLDLRHAFGAGLAGEFGEFCARGGGLFARVDAPLAFFGEPCAEVVHTSNVKYLTSDGKVKYFTCMSKTAAATAPKYAELYLTTNKRGKAAFRCYMFGRTYPVARAEAIASIEAGAAVFLGTFVDALNGNAPQATSSDIVTALAA